jgi:predicted ATP-binding protein involved in virulence
MKIKNLTLGKYRAFDFLELDFHPQVNVIAGINGIGKSSILNALNILIYKALPQFTRARFQKDISFVTEDVSVNKSEMVAQVYFSEEKEVYFLSIIATFDEMKIFEQVQKEYEQIRFSSSISERKTTDWDEEREKRFKLRNTIEEYKSLLTGELEVRTRNRLESSELRHQLRNRTDHPVYIYFGSTRQIPLKLMRPKRRLSRESTYFNGINSAYQEALVERAVDFAEFMVWYEAKLELANQYGENHLKTIQALEQAIRDFMPDFENLRIEKEPKPHLVIYKNSVPLNLNQLSDGEKGLLAILFDITRRLSVANPTLKNPVRDGEGVILIDELELHLHPSWQRDALRRLTATFQNCQFIITTHSPQIIGEVPAECIRFLTRDENGKVIQWTPPQALGLDSNRVLEELMGVPSRNAVTDAQLQELFRTVDAEDFVAARAMIAKIQKTLGNEDPEITRAEALISFLEDS